MAELDVDLPAAAVRQAEKIFVEIQKSGSMIMAVKTGAKAHGFVLGLKCSSVISEEAGDRLQARFDASTEQKLKELALWIDPGTGV